MLRRNFLLTISGYGSAFFLSACEKKIDPDTLLEIEKLTQGFTEYLVNNEQILLIGEEYLKRRPDQPTLMLLKKELVENYSVRRHKNLTLYLQSQIKVDFNSAKSFQFDGWIISNTEGLLSAIITYVT